MPVLKVTSNLSLIILFHALNNMLSSFLSYLNFVINQLNINDSIINKLWVVCVHSQNKLHESKTLPALFTAVSLVPTTVLAHGRTSGNGSYWYYVHHLISPRCLISFVPEHTGQCSTSTTRSLSSFQKKACSFLCRLPAGPLGDAHTKMSIQTCACEGMC